MKKLAFLFLSAALLAAWAGCKKDTPVDYQQLDDEALAAAIADDRGKQELDPSTLPADIADYVRLNDFETYIDAAYFVDGKGYDVTLATEEHVYFNLSRRALLHRLNDRIGPCGRLLGGRIIPIDSLRPAIVQYVTEHYPDAQILRAKRQGDRVILLLSDQILLVFSADGVFELNDLQWTDCRPCAPGGVADLPASIVTMIQNRIPGADIKRVCHRGDRIIIGVSDGSQRFILVYDNNWNFLFAIH